MNDGVNLHELLKRRRYDHCLISTFTFSPRFFEQYALERFKALQDNGNITVFLDRGQYEEMIEGVTSMNGWSPRLANLRYLLHPIRVPGVFHPKVFLFANAKRGLLVIGSANFSQDGLGSNAELVSTFEFELGKNESAQPLFQEALQFFEALVLRWPSREVASNVDDVRRSVPWLTEALESPRDPHLPLLLSNLEEPLWPQLARELPEQVDSISLVSRFFDSSPQMLETVIEQCNAPRLDIYTQAAVNKLGPLWMESPLYREGRLKIHLCRYEEDEHMQKLHGKAYAFCFGQKFVIASGSANFSTAALLRPAASGNVEVLLLYPPRALSSLKPGDIFDPLSSAAELVNVDQLGYIDNEPTEPVSKPSGLKDMIDEAVLDDDTLHLNFRMTVSGMQCRIFQAKVRPVTLTLTTMETGAHKLTLAPPLARRMASAPSVIQLGERHGDDWRPLSNPLFVAAPFGERAGTRSKQHRRMQEAIENPQRFANVLLDLCTGDDLTRLQNFLTHCNIPLDLVMKRMRKRQKGGNGGPSSGPPTEFKNLGSRNLRHFNDLHDATVGFLARHRSKLERHVESGTAAGISNYLHILESMLRLLHTQIERAAVGLESDDEIILTQDEWKNTRDHLSDYYQELGALLRLTSSEYVYALLKEEKRAVVCEGFGSAAEDILEWVLSCLKLRENINQARIKNLRVETPTGPTEAMFFHTKISDAKWGSYVIGLKQLAAELREQLSA